MDHRLGSEPPAECGPKSQSVLSRAPEFHRDLKVARSLGLTTAQFYALPEDEQALQVEAFGIEQEVCSHGGPADECGDPERKWYPQRTICYATMEAAAANALYDELHEERPFHDGTFTKWSDKRTASHPYHARDGVTIWVAREDLSPSDKFLGSP